MQYRVSFLVLLMMVLIGNATAQQQATFKINFNTDEHVLDKHDESILEQLLAAARLASYYEIKISAHTDSDADNIYNEKLSERRAQSVKDYLLANAIKPRNIVSNALGERKPEADNGNEEGKAANRRVEIMLNTYTFHSTSDLIKQVSPDYKQSFVVEAGEQNIIKGVNGTTVIIPANSLLTRNGKPVKGKVTIVLNEFLKPSDAAFNQLSTVSNGKLLESGGMFSVTAYAGDEEVHLKKGQTMSVKMPTINMKNGMNLFTAVTTAEGITEWKPTSVSFMALLVDRASVAFVTLDTKYLRSLMMDCGPAPAYASYSYTLPALPQRPAEISKKPVYHAPVYAKVFPWYKRLFVSRKTLERKFAAITARREKAYARRLAAYDKEVANLQPLWEQYRIDSSRFEGEELQQFRTWLEEQSSLHALNAEYTEKSQWNKALEGLVAQSNDNAIINTDIKSQFERSVGPYSKYFFDAYAHRNALRIISFLKEKSMHELAKFYGKETVSLHYTRYRNSLFMGKLAASTFAGQKLAENKQLLVMLDKAVAELLKKQADAKAFDESKVGNVYTTSLSSFGMFNCDRFYQTPPDQMAAINIPGTDEARVAFFVPSLNSYLYANRDKSGYYASLPKGMDVKVIYASFNKKDGPVLQIVHKRFTENTTIDIKPKPVSLKEMEKALASI